MSTIVVVVEGAEGGGVTKSSLAALTAAQAYAAVVSGEVRTLALGAGAETVARGCAEFGVAEALWANGPSLQSCRAVPFGDAIVEVVKTLGAGAVFFASTSFGKDVAPRVAALLDGGQASDIIAVLPDGGFRRPMYAGDVLADVEVTTPFKVVTVRTSAFAPAVAGGAGAAIREVQLSGAIRDVGQVTGYEGARSERPELAGAAVVVSGGRALGSAENFQKVMFPLADALHAAVGASRAAVDSGYAPNDWQVGQTGKIVAPGLYIAVGISGAIQHLAGMKDSKVIVAINKDPEAPIFDVATYGLVGDLFTVVPAFLDELRK